MLVSLQMVQTKTKIITEQHRGYETKDSPSEPSKLLAAADLIASFTYDKDFLNILEQHDASPEDQTSYQYAQALSSYVNKYVNTRSADGTLTLHEATRLQLIGEYPLSCYRDKIVTDWSEEFSRRRQEGQHIDPQDRQFLRDCKAGLVRYNQTISDYLYEHGSALKLSDISGALSVGVGQMSPDTARDSSLKMAEILRGARTEAINRQLVDRLHEMVPDQISGRRATVEEDLAGVDYVVTVHGAELYLDFKSSLSALTYKSSATADNLAAGYTLRTARSGAKIATVAPSFDEASLRDACTLPEAQLTPMAITFSNTLSAVYKEVKK